MIRGNRVRLNQNYGHLRAGSIGVIKSFVRDESGENVIVQFDEGDEMLPWIELELIESAAPIEPEPECEGASASSIEPFALPLLVVDD